MICKNQSKVLFTGKCLLSYAVVAFRSHCQFVSIFADLFFSFDGRKSVGHVERS